MTKERDLIKFLKSFNTLKKVDLRYLTNPNIIEALKGHNIETFKCQLVKSSYSIQNEIASFLKTRSFKLLSITGFIITPELIKTLTQVNTQEFEITNQYLKLVELLKIIRQNKSIKTLRISCNLYSYENEFYDSLSELNDHIYETIYIGGYFLANSKKEIFFDFLDKFNKNIYFWNLLESFQKEDFLRLGKYKDKRFIQLYYTNSIEEYETALNEDVHFCNYEISKHISPSSYQLLQRNKSYLKSNSYKFNSKDIDLNFQS